jgi:hypothetical protein
MALVYRVGQAWDAIVYVDGFAGPWGAKDKSFADSSFGIAMRVLKDAVAGLKEKYGKTARGLCIFVEKKPDAFARLDAYAQSSSTETRIDSKDNGKDVKSQTTTTNSAADSDGIFRGPCARRIVFGGDQPMTRVDGRRTAATNSGVMRWVRSRSRALRRWATTG